MSNNRNLNKTGKSVLSGFSIPSKNSSILDVAPSNHPNYEKNQIYSPPLSPEMKQNKAPITHEDLNQRLRAEIR